MGETSSLAMKLVLATLVVLAAVSYAAELKIETTFKPEGCTEATMAKAGDHLSMHYTGTIDESSEAGTKGFDFQLGAGQVIKGWDEGLLGMCVCEKRVLTIPPEKGYGAQGAGGAIPGGATLNFDVELLA